MTRPVSPTNPPDPEAIKASYGFVGALAKAVPEIDGILQKAVKEQWTTDRFLMAVADTSWYKNNSDRAREWATKQITDPASANREWLVATDAVNSSAGRWGVSLTMDQAREAALHRMLHGLNDDQFKDHLFRTYFSGFGDWNKLSGEAAKTAQEIQVTGWQYGWRDFDNYNESRGWLDKIMTGKDTIDGFKTAMMNYAKTRYPALTQQLESGLTVRQIAKPYQERMAELLEIPETEIELNNPLLSRALQARKDNGEPTHMPTWQFEQLIRQDSRWGKTNNAFETAAETVKQIGKAFGMVT